MTIPRRPDDGREIEQRLERSWRAAVARAEQDLADRELVSLAPAAGPRARRTGLAVAGVAALAIAAVAFVAVWSGGQFLGTVATSPSPVESQGVTGSIAPTPTATASPADGGIPFLGPGQTFPPTVDGQLVVQVGPEADARIAAATDDSPISVSGWILHPTGNWHGCSTPDDFLGPDCISAQLSAGADGGAALRIFSTAASPPGLSATPALVQPVLIQVHVNDPACDGPECARRPVLDRVLEYGATSVAPWLLTNALPSGGISAEQAVEIARNDVQRYPPLVPGQLPVLWVAAGPDALLEGIRGSQPERWLWNVHLVSDDGGTEYDSTVDFLDGTVLGAGSGRFPIAADGAAPLDPDQAMPPDGISLEEAVAAARGHDISTFGEPLVLLSARAGPSALLDEDRHPPELGWVWAIDFSSDDGYRTYTAYVDYRTGDDRGSQGGTVNAATVLLH